MSQQGSLKPSRTQSGPAKHAHAGRLVPDFAEHAGTQHACRVSRCLFLLFGFLLCLSVLGCQDREREPEKTTQNALAKAPHDLVVGFSQTGAEGSWRVAHTNSILSEAKKRGVQLLFADGQNVHNNQVNAVNGFITKGVDIIVISPQESMGWKPTLKEAKRAGIPVILTSRGVDADEDLYETVIAADFLWEGREAARWLVTKTGGKANIIEIVGTPAADVAVLRKKGFAEVIDEHPGMKILASQSGDFTRTKARAVMAALLEAHKGQIDAVYAHDDPMALGAIQAIEAAGIEPGKDIIVIGVGAVKAGFEAMISGTLNSTVECTPLHGPLVFDAIEKVAKGEKLPKKIVVPGQVFEQSQAAAMIDSRTY